MPYNVTTIRRWLYKIWFEKKINIHALRYPLGPFLIEFREDYSQIHPPKNCKFITQMMETRELHQMFLKYHNYY